jgi:alpha-L-rhamnosidase
MSLILKNVFAFLIGTLVLMNSARAVELKITRALYEATDGAGSKDVTDVVSKQVKNNALEIWVDNGQLGGDPAQGHAKELKINYSIDGRAMEIIGAEATLVSINSEPPWTAQWIWQASDGPKDTWMAFRKTFQVGTLPQAALAKIAADSRYWLWINGRMVVREGELKRGPTPIDTYYDEVDLRPYLKPGSNTVAALVSYWGVSGFSHLDSGKGGFLFDCKSLGWYSDATWKMRIHPAFSMATFQPNSRLSEPAVRFDGAKDIPDWINPAYNDTSWSPAVAKGPPPTPPWNHLVKRPIPQWRDGEILPYQNEDELALPFEGKNEWTVCRLPENIQVYPALVLTADKPGLKVTIRSGNKFNNSQVPDFITEYLTRGDGREERFESPNWINGDSIEYEVPNGVTIKSLGYRPTGYDTDPTGSFTCSDDFLNTLWTKAQRTLGVCIRDNYMDCPDRERAAWVGDMATDIGESFYAFDRRIDPLTVKCIDQIVNWQRPGGVMFGPVPGNWNQELPTQIMAFIGEQGIWSYYLYSGDKSVLPSSYPAIKSYLHLWQLDGDGLVQHRTGEWDWMDDGGNPDVRVIDNCRYYSALKAARDMALVLGERSDITEDEQRMHSIETNFNRVLWNAQQNCYSSPGRQGSGDDRGNGLAVVVGLADKSKWPSIQAFLSDPQHFQAGPWVEKSVDEALLIMGQPQAAFDRIKARYTPMMKTPSTTLWEHFDLQGSSQNHAWSGGPLTLLSQYVAGVAPETPGFESYHVLPELGDLTSVEAVVPSIRGKIKVSIHRDPATFSLNLESPPGTSAIVGIPVSIGGKATRQITMGNLLVWNNGVFAPGITPPSAGSRDGFIKFKVPPGHSSFLARP